MSLDELSAESWIQCHLAPRDERSPAADTMLEMLARAAGGYAANFARDRIRSVA